MGAVLGIANVDIEYTTNVQPLELTIIDQWKF